MNTLNTPTLTTSRLILRRFKHEDLPALLDIFGDELSNRFLPWFPAKNLLDARGLFTHRYLETYSQPRGYGYAICMKEGNLPIGYINLSTGDSHDLGYGLRHQFWGHGIAAEAAQALISKARADGLPYITATHDVNNPASGRVMQKLGMTYRYSYLEQWQPKDIPVIFRMYQLNFSKAPCWTYTKYWDMSQVHFVESGI